MKGVEVSTLALGVWPRFAGLVTDALRFVLLCLEHRLSVKVTGCKAVNGLRIPAQVLGFGDLNAGVRVKMSSPTRKDPRKNCVAW